jgi:hypothetical protein
VSWDVAACVVPGASNPLIAAMGRRDESRRSFPLICAILVETVRAAQCRSVSGEELPAPRSAIAGCGRNRPLGVRFLPQSQIAMSARLALANRDLPSPRRRSQGGSQGGRQPEPRQAPEYGSLRHRWSEGGRMGKAIGDALPIAMGIALSAVPDHRGGADAHHRNCTDQRSRVCDRVVNRPRCHRPDRACDRRSGGRRCEQFRQTGEFGTMCSTETPPLRDIAFISRRRRPWWAADGRS